MSPEEIVEIVRATLFVTLELSAPFLITALVIGFLISLFQSMTQIHEMTLTFVPKMVIITAVLVFLFPWILKIMTKFTHDLFIYRFSKLIHDHLSY